MESSVCHMVFPHLSLSTGSIALTGLYLFEIHSHIAINIKQKREQTEGGTAFPLVSMEEEVQEKTYVAIPDAKDLKKARGF